MRKAQGSPKGKMAGSRSTKMAGREVVRYPSKSKLLIDHRHNTMASYLAGDSLHHHATCHQPGGSRGGDEG